MLDNYLDFSDWNVFSPADAQYLYDDDESDEDEYSYPVPRVKEVIGVISDDEGNEDMLVV